MSVVSSDLWNTCFDQEYAGKRRTFDPSRVLLIAVTPKASEPSALSSAHNGLQIQLKVAHL